MFHVLQTHLLVCALLLSLFLVCNRWMCSVWLKNGVKVIKRCQECWANSRISVPERSDSGAVDMLIRWFSNFTYSPHTLPLQPYSWSKCVFWAASCSSHVTTANQPASAQCQYAHFPGFPVPAVECICLLELYYQHDPELRRWGCSGAALTSNWYCDVGKRFPRISVCDSLLLNMREWKF